MKENLSLSSRRELVANFRLKYQEANWKWKNKLLDGFIAASGYQRKYAIYLLNRADSKPKARKSTMRQLYYDQEVKNALVSIWQVANQICAKRLVPFIPELMNALERHGHLNLPMEVRRKLLSLSAATVDRVLKSERQKQYKNISHTKPGALLKKQIQVRIFWDWNDVTPGFFEGDLVVHCGGDTHGSFLCTFVLTDIATGWTEFIPLLCKSSAYVIDGMGAVSKLLPFPLLGLDTDNGSEFINYDLVDYCKVKEITFTRSRARKSNDQAHVEEKNGSIVRRIVGYDRFEGHDAWRALADLYATLRLYVNYFQPSLKLQSKHRDGSKVTKKYDTAKTPYQRLLDSNNLSDENKSSMDINYKKLDPIFLLKQLSNCQDKFWKFAWANLNRDNKSETLAKIIAIDVLSSQDTECPETIAALDQNNLPKARYKRSQKPRKRLTHRTWRTRLDCFEGVWNDLRQKLELNPQETAKTLLDELVGTMPDKFNYRQLRTLQRRVAEWRTRQNKLANSSYVDAANSITKPYLSLVLEGRIG